MRVKTLNFKANARPNNSLSIKVFQDKT